MTTQTPIAPAPEHHGKRPLLSLRRQPGRLALVFMRMPLRAYRHDRGALLGHTFVQFTHTGRKSGKSYDSVAMVLGYDEATGEVVICACWDTDWYRNLQASPATLVKIGHESFVPQQRFLTDDEALTVGLRFRAAHPHRMRLIGRVLGWGDLRDDAQLRAFVRAHPFLAFRPAAAIG
jgi:deazaflavin-dependent oxidoreductase (nitroreductase family)